MTNQNLEAEHNSNENTSPNTVYSAVLERLRSQGFYVSLQDIADVHEHLRQGGKPYSVIGQAIEAALQRAMGDEE